METMDDTKNDTVTNNKEIVDKSIPNFCTVNMISPDTMVTCGKCKEQMNFEKYNVVHRGLHYNLCWLDGIEDEIDFTNTSKLKTILKNFTTSGTTQIKFQCEWCNDLKMSVYCFIKHIQNCQSNPMLLSMNDTVSKQSEVNRSSIIDAHNDDSVVSCGRCDTSMSYAEYKNNHRYNHYNLCWLDGEDKLDYEDEMKTAKLLRSILPKNAERNKKVSFKCEWCSEIKKSVMGFAKHVKMCTTGQVKVTSNSWEKGKKEKEELASLSEKSSLGEKPNLEKQDIIHDSVTCGLCQKTMPLSEYKKTHKLTHYNLSWIDDDEKPDLNDEECVRRLLKTSLSNNAYRNKTIRFVCEWCQKQNKSVVGFASHIKQCKLRPDKICMLNETNSESNSNTVPEIINFDSMVTCGRCNTEMSRREYFYEHSSSKHYNLCWIDGEQELDLQNYDTVIRKVSECISFKAIRSRNVTLKCEKCNTVKKSVAGFASHVIFCSKGSVDSSSLLIMCGSCGSKVKPPSMAAHKLKFCKGFGVENCDDSINNKSNYTENKRSSQILRQKKRPPNILTFYPGTRFASDYHDCMCRLCDYIAPNVKDILNHILKVHHIDINQVDTHFILNNYILNTYDLHESIYLRPLLNYYNYSKKILCTGNNHEDFQTNIELLNDDDAVKYLPSVQDACKIFNSDEEEMSVNLFKSAHINDTHWLFTGGPIWAMSWCPVPEGVQIQYLAISCHPKPDLEHKEMTNYKYPSLVQLWNFSLLNNLNCDSICDEPFMSYGLAHDFGAVWDMEWCPSGAYEPKKKIGLLALSTSTGDCPIFAMPYVDGNSEMFYMYKAKPVIARNFEFKWTEVGVQCTKLCWNKVSPFNTLICGYSNGTVCVFVMNFKSLFFRDDILYPSHFFRASKCGITGLSVNYLNSSILATTSVDGYVVLWDLKSTEYPIFQKKYCFASDCAWLHQCHTLAFCSKVANINSVQQKVQTINFFSYDDSIGSYNPDLYVLKNVVDNSKVLSNYNMLDNHEISNCESVGESSGLNDSYSNSDDETFKPFGSSNNNLEDFSKNIDDEEWFGPSFFQRCVHWSISGSNWINVIATADENGGFYEKLFIPASNKFEKEHCTKRQLMARKLSSDVPQSVFGPTYMETVKKFGLQSRIVPPNEDLINDPNDNPLLRYPLENITRISWNQNFNSFRWLAIGTQSGFALIFPSQTISDDTIKSFYKIVSSSD